MAITTRCAWSDRRRKRKAWTRAIFRITALMGSNRDPVVALAVDADELGLALQPEKAPWVCAPHECRRERQERRALEALELRRNVFQYRTPDAIGKLGEHPSEVGADALATRWPSSPAVPTGLQAAARRGSRTERHGGGRSLCSRRCLGPPPLAPPRRCRPSMRSLARAARRAR